ncbi:nicotinate (nicotinamide) nucleotide adenylyltransferase [Advenella sp. WQ 585]|uniref:Probable nicotinate-nucleotide adenylyltransferase n=1 Tax=Advenella mandrilli TaxID=2800330 RepID=A0ABS1EBS0_9BURK|nr:nicotinate (nicotinamide) nucleotide adenylyltransferase [Advenella mandrilli]MBK1781044.1 nicotinate (nicotinamide) nucleotide adenylyltransferase [Advenella mandrilli]
MKKIGLLGGSFNPVHNAHLALAHTALDALSLDEVQFIPVGNPWQKQALTANGQQRLDMLGLAITGQPGMTVNDIEITRQGATYTIDTLKALPENACYYWLLGTDQLANFCTWHQWEDIINHVTLVVAQRNTHPFEVPRPLAEKLQQKGKKLITLSFEAVDISSSDIRQRLANHHDVNGLLPQPVLEYIRQHKLYT